MAYKILTLLAVILLVAGLVTATGLLADAKDWQSESGIRSAATGFGILNVFKAKKAPTAQPSPPPPLSGGQFAPSPFALPAIGQRCTYLNRDNIDIRYEQYPNLGTADGKSSQVICQELNFDSCLFGNFLEQTTLYESIGGICKTSGGAIYLPQFSLIKDCSAKQNPLPGSEALCSTSSALPHPISSADEVPHYYLDNKHYNFLAGVVCCNNV